jgi:uncharacterized protein (TIGR02611 family)
MKRIRAYWRKKLGWVPRPVRRAIILVFGGTIAIIGVIMIIPPVPGPGIVVIPLGLAILAIEFVWARRWLKKIKAAATNMHKRVKGGIGPRESQQPVAASPENKNAQ